MIYSNTTLTHQANTDVFSATPHPPLRLVSAPALTAVTTTTTPAPCLEATSSQPQQRPSPLRMAGSRRLTQAVKRTEAVKPRRRWSVRNTGVGPVL